MPYRDPHTAAPALWALRQKFGCISEASVTVVEGATPWRKGLEAIAIALYRQRYGESPTANFGRIIPGYRMPSHNNARLATAGQRFRGSLTLEATMNHLPSLRPIGRLTGDPIDPRWCGHHWSTWSSLPRAGTALSTSDTGLYRLRTKGGKDLLYVGEGKIATRLNAHLRKARLPNDAEGSVLAAADNLECSFVVESRWTPNQRLELETDLIGAYVLALGRVPVAQFLGGSVVRGK